MIRIISTSESDYLTNFTCQVILGSISNDLTSLHTSESPQIMRNPGNLHVGMRFFKVARLLSCQPKRGSIWHMSLEPFAVVHLQKTTRKEHLTLLMEEILHQLRLVVCSVIYNILYIIIYNLYIYIYIHIHPNYWLWAVGGISEPSTTGMIFVAVLFDLCKVVP